MISLAFLVYIVPELLKFPSSLKQKDLRAGEPMSTPGFLTRRLEVRCRAGQDKPLGWVHIEVLLDRAYILRGHLKKDVMVMLLSFLNLNHSGLIFLIVSAFGEERGLESLFPKWR